MGVAAVRGRGVDDISSLLSMYPPRPSSLIPAPQQCTEDEEVALMSSADPAQFLKYTLAIVVPPLGIIIPVE